MPIVNLYFLNHLCSQGEVLLRHLCSKRGEFYYTSYAPTFDTSRRRVHQPTKAFMSSGSIPLGLWAAATAK